MHSTFEKCELRAAFIDCNLSLAVFDSTNFSFSEFQRTKLSGAIFADCVFETANVDGCDLRGTGIIRCKFIKLSAEDTGAVSRVNRRSFFGEVSFDPASKWETAFAADTYALFYDLFHNNSVNAMSGEYFYRYKTTELKQLQGVPQWMSAVGWLSCGYGERPFFSLLSSFLIILVFAMLYQLVGINLHADGVGPSPGGAITAGINFASSFRFSAQLFFVGDGHGFGLLQGNSVAFVLGLTERIVGIIMITIFVSTLVRKMAR